MNIFSPLLRSGQFRTHMMRYRNSPLGSAISKDRLNLAEHTCSRYEVSERIVVVLEAKDSHVFRVQLEGIPVEREWTWKSVGNIYGDIPEIVPTFLKGFKSKKNFVSKVKCQLFLPLNVVFKNIEVPRTLLNK